MLPISIFKCTLLTSSPLYFSEAMFSIVVEPSLIESLAANCPSIRSFQQLKKFIIQENYFSSGAGGILYARKLVGDEVFSCQTEFRESWHTSCLICGKINTNTITFIRIFTCKCTIYHKRNLITRQSYYFHNKLDYIFTFPPEFMFFMSIMMPFYNFSNTFR